MIDIGDALRLRSGLSREQGGEKLWSVWSFINPEILEPADLERVRRLAESRELFPERSELGRLLQQTVKAMREVWRKTLEDLKQTQELERFLKIEVPVRQIFSFRQYQGLQLDSDAGVELIGAARNQKYTAFRELAKVLGYSPTGLSFHNIGDYLENTDASHLSQYAHSNQLEQYFKIAQYSSAFADSFLRFIKASRALSVLRTINYSVGRVYPAFDCFGTVTARILVVDPKLQQLPKQFRNVLAPDNGMSLWYFDFAQFEPGILACLAGDKEFIDYYQSLDVYTALSHAVFDTATERDLCKSIFLAYCYGMTLDRISLLLARKPELSGRGNLQLAMSQFFDSMPFLDKFRQLMQENLERDGFVATLLGDRRYRKRTGPLGEKEKRWALNQAVQGTASLVFKQALLDLAARFGPGSILLPMHDGILMQFDVDSDPQADVESTMVSAFQRWCPAVKPRVSVGAFATKLPAKSQAGAPS